ncbi:MAG: gamma-glutamyl-gamma-aminobutyrate hydrolase family protein, partial [Clostridiales Family XIII bacterium]|nr:gamma-glutamyl-gamma-aminobutyrate hydrolase family protein [Clostridiales Family XIII bacterium]
MIFEGIWVVDFGGQYNQLIARRVREAQVYCEIMPYHVSLRRIESGEKPRGIIFTGGPSSVCDDGAPTLPASFFESGIPILGICYGAQLMAHVLGGKVASPDSKEYGKIRIYQGNGVLNRSGAAENQEPDQGTAGASTPPIAGENGAANASPEDATVVDVRKGRDSGASTPYCAQAPRASDLFFGIADGQHCWMSHTDYIAEVPAGFAVTSFTDNCPTASMENAAQGLYGVQFHPEVHHTPFGRELLKNFLYRVCGCKDDWTMHNFAETKIEEIKSYVGDNKVICALSGGVDSSVAAVLTHKAIGGNLTCIFVDHGLLRKGEGDQVMDVYGKQFNMKIIRVDAAERFLSKLAG